MKMFPKYNMVGYGLKNTVDKTVELKRHILHDMEQFRKQRKNATSMNWHKK